MAGTWALLSVTLLCAAVVLCGASGVVAAVESDAVGVDERFGGFAADPLSGNTIFLESDEMEGDAAFETEGEMDADAEADSDELADAESEADAESDADAAFEGEEESWTEATGMDSEFDESDAEALADEDEFDVAADEEVEAEIDASAQVTLQSYAASQGALESDADAALASLSSESELSEVEAAAEAEADAEAEMESEMEGGKDAVAVKGGKKKKGKKHAIAKKKALTGLKMSQLNLRDDKGKGAKINLAGGKGRYSMGVNPAGVFTIDMEGRNILSVSGKSGMVRARGDVTVWNTLRAGSLTLNQVPQWKMVRQDTFEKFVALPKRPVLEGIEVTKHTNPTAVAKAGAQITAADVAHAPQPPSAGAVKPNTKAAAAALTAAQSPDKATAAAKALAKKARGWLYDDVIKCNGFTMLSAKPHRSITTLYKRLPKHTQIRVTATVHFIDDWQGETAWLKLNDKFVWTESHDQRSVAGKFSMCGSELYPESRFAAPIDVIWPHRSKKLTLALGSNLDEGSDARFAVSNVAIYTRDTSRRKPKAKFVMKKVCKKDKKSGKEVCKMMKVPVKPHHKPCKKGKDGKCLPKPKPSTPATPAAPAPAPATPAAPADPAAPSTMPKF